MLTNAQLKLYASLKSKKFRKAHGLYVAEGQKVVGELLLTKLRARHVLIKKGTVPSFPVLGIPVDEVSDSEMGQISSLDTPPDVLCIAEIPTTYWNGQLSGINLYLDGISDPGNMGTIIRTAEWFGVECVFTSSDCVELYAPKVVQSAMGSLFRMHVLPLAFADVVRAANQNKTPILATVLDGQNLNTIEKLDRAVVVIGSESHGISDTVRAGCSGFLTIPRAPKAATESLNAGIATAIVLHQITR